MDSIDITAIAPKIEKFVKKEGKLLSACIVPHTPTSLPSASWVMVHLLVTVRTGPVAMESFTLPLLSPPLPHPYFSITPLPFIFCLPPSSLVLSPRSSFNLCASL